jgi:hypothetical protein
MPRDSASIRRASLATPTTSGEPSNALDMDRVVEADREPDHLHAEAFPESRRKLGVRVGDQTDRHATIARAARTRPS